jgi:hypothetical protein
MSHAIIALVARAYHLDAELRLPRAFHLSVPEESTVGPLSWAMKRSAQLLPF